MITDVPGVRVGHWTDPVAKTGCTVALLPAKTLASGEVRGGAPATREWDLLSPERRVAHIDAVVLSGGSAFGLAAADGVMRFCEERGIGHPTAFGPVPIVVGASLFDLMVGDGSVRPGPDEGYAACEAATDGLFELGPVGAGAGATVGMWRPETARPGGVGSASIAFDDLIVGALVAVNAYGSVLQQGEEAKAAVVPEPTPAFAGNTTIGLVATNAALDKAQCLWVAQGAHDGLARVLAPAHTTYDGDAMVAASTGDVAATVDTVRSLGAWAVVEAVRAAVAH
ncbi:MAG: P1 family peptidase [Acidimicrobiia bacterium]|nr:P1 family peptidase [Acidimicrobiia bacterium]